MVNYLIDPTQIFQLTRKLFIEDTQKNDRFLKENLKENISKIKIFRS